MYLVGGEHRLKAEAQVLLERLAAGNQRLVTDAEVLQEILHRYTAVDRRMMIGRAFKALLDIVDDVFAVEKYDVLRAAEIAQTSHSPPGMPSTLPWSIAGFNRSGVLPPISIAGRD
jgi:predicted nucleic acid-binding protein